MRQSIFALAVACALTFGLAVGLILTVVQAPGPRRGAPAGQVQPVKLPPMPAWATVDGIPVNPNQP
jgi:hypothetical protein